MNVEERAKRRAAEKVKRVLKVGVITGVIAGVLVTGLISIIANVVKSNKYDKNVAKLEAEIKELKGAVKEKEEKQANLKNPAEQLKSDSEDWCLALVNDEYLLDKEYEPELESLSSNVEVDARIYDITKKMFDAAKEEGLNMDIRSAYRSYETQEKNFCNDMNSWIDSGYNPLEAYNLTIQSVALPGCSEHTTGLSLDIVSASNDNLDDSQENTEEIQWLMEHCWEYGFILRYPKDKTDVTGITYEPWHYRYVGETAAKEITEQGITLEEYLGVK